MKLLMVPLTLTLVAAPVLAADKRVDDAVARAEAHLEKGKPEEALKVMQKVASQVGTAEAYAALGRIQIRAGNVEEAAASMAKAVELGASAAPDMKAEALAALSALDLVRGSGRDALTHAQGAVDAQATPKTLAALARAQARAGDPAVALQTADKAVAAGANDAGAHEARGAALLALARGPDAEAAFSKALQLDPKMTVARVGLARALLAQGKAAAAEAEAKKASDADPRSGEAFALLGRAMLAVDPKRWGEAIAQAQQGAFLNARNAVVQTEVGGIFDAGDNLEQAATAYRKALDADPTYGPARVALLNIQVRRGQLDAALTEAQKMAQELPNDAGAQLLLGKILLRKADYAGAATALERAVQLSPGVAEAQAGFGTALQYRGRTPEALEAYKEAVKLDPKNLEYRVTYGLLLGLSNEEAAGAAELIKVIANPAYKGHAAHVNLGWVYRNMEPPKAAESVAAYKKALELNSKDAQSNLGLGWAYTSLKKFDDSIASFNKAMELDPKTSGEANHGIAWSYFFKNDMPKAKEFGAKATAAGRNDPGLRANIERKERGEARAEAQDEAEKAMREAAKRREIGPLEALQSRDAGVRRKACGDAVRLGAEAVNSLVIAVRGDKDMGVREACARSLGSLGPAAKPAIPHLMHLLTPPPVNPNATPAEIRAEAEWEDFRRVVRDAVKQIQGR